MDSFCHLPAPGVNKACHCNIDGGHGRQAVTNSNFRNSMEFSMDLCFTEPHLRQPPEFD